MVDLAELKTGIEGSIEDLNKEISTLEEIINNTESNKNKLLQYLGRRHAFQLTLNTIVADNESSDTNNKSEDTTDSSGKAAVAPVGTSNRPGKRSKRIAKSSTKNSN